MNLLSTGGCVFGAVSVNTRRVALPEGVEAADGALKAPRPSRLGFDVVDATVLEVLSRCSLRRELAAEGADSFLSEGPVRSSFALLEFAVGLEVLVDAASGDTSSVDAMGRARLHVYLFHPFLEPRLQFMPSLRLHRLLHKPGLVPLYFRP